MDSSYNKIKKICKDTQKFDKKIGGKQFLLGKYFQGSKKRTKQKPKKFPKSKIRKLLQRQISLTKDEITYDFFLPLHNLWCGYMEELTKDEKNQESRYLKIMRGDFHGAEIQVVHSKIDSYIGVEGIIILQTLKTYKVITKDNSIKNILKNEIVFKIEVQDRSYVINGNCLIFRGTDRTKHKFKARKAESINIKFMETMLEQSKQ